MKKSLTIFLLCSCIFCAAQQKIPYANFIQTDTAIKWAAICNSYINLTPSNLNFSIRDFYIEKLKKGYLKTYIEDSPYLKVTPVEISYQDVIKNINYKPYDGGRMINWVYHYDERHDASEEIFNSDKDNCDTCLSVNKLNLFKVKQLLFYKNHQLQIKNILLTPILYKKKETERDESSMFAELPNVIFDNGKGKSGIPGSAVFMGRSCNHLELIPSIDDIVNGSKILTVDDWNLTALLFKDAKRGNLKFYNVEKEINPNVKSIFRKDTIEYYGSRLYDVPIYDTEGNVTGTKLIREEMNLDSFYNYQLIQDFYFDFENEKIYSQLVALAIQRRIYTSVGDYIGLQNYWGVLFPEKKNTKKK